MLFLASLRAATTSSVSFNALKSKHHVTNRLPFHFLCGMQGLFENPIVTCKEKKSTIFLPRVSNYNKQLIMSGFFRTLMHELASVVGSFSSEDRTSHRSAKIDAHFSLHQFCSQCGCSERPCCITQQSFTTPANSAVSLSGAETVLRQCCLSTAACSNACSLVCSAQIRPVHMGVVDSCCLHFLMVYQLHNFERLRVIMFLSFYIW